MDVNRSYIVPVGVIPPHLAVGSIWVVNHTGETLVWDGAKFVAPSDVEWDWEGGITVHGDMHG